MLQCCLAPPRLPKPDLLNLELVMGVWKLALHLRLATCLALRAGTTCAAQAPSVEFCLKQRTCRGRSPSAAPSCMPPTRPSVSAHPRQPLLLAAVALSLLASVSAQQLIACLGKLDADLVSAQNVDLYDLARQVANKRVLREPIAVVYPRTLSAVQGAVNCSRLAGFPAVARSGGHGYEGAVWVQALASLEDLSHSSWQLPLQHPQLASHTCLLP